MTLTDEQKKELKIFAYDTYQHVGYDLEAACADMGEELSWEDTASLIRERLCDALHEHKKGRKYGDTAAKLQVLVGIDPFGDEVRALVNAEVRRYF